MKLKDELEKLEKAAVAIRKKLKPKPTTPPGSTVGKWEKG